jgi:hypothetical protein
MAIAIRQLQKAVRTRWGCGGEPRHITALQSLVSFRNASPDIFGYLQFAR